MYTKEQKIKILKGINSYLDADCMKMDLDEDCVNLNNFENSIVSNVDYYYYVKIDIDSDTLYASIYKYYDTSTQPSEDDPGSGDGHEEIYDSESVDLNSELVDVLNKIDELDEIPRIKDLDFIEALIKESNDLDSDSYGLTYENEDRG